MLEFWFWNPDVKNFLCKIIQKFFSEIYAKSRKFYSAKFLKSPENKLVVGIKVDFFLPFSQIQENRRQKESLS